MLCNLFELVLLEFRHGQQGSVDGEANGGERVQVRLRTSVFSPWSVIISTSGTTGTPVLNFPRRISKAHGMSEINHGLGVQRN
jgi:hypothetical protein